jgi:signal transduction protein with GAF and PtsI domain
MSLKNWSKGNDGGKERKEPRSPVEILVGMYNMNAASMTAEGEEAFATFTLKDVKAALDTQEELRVMGFKDGITVHESKITVPLDVLTNVSATFTADPSGRRNKNWGTTVQPASVRNAEGAGGLPDR